MEFLKKNGSTIISVLATIVVGYLGVIWSQNQFKKAEIERQDRAKKELVEVIEEHIINQKQIKPSRLSRLISIKCSEENLQEEFLPLELLKSAESNLLESRHLDFKQKENYKILFDSIYTTFVPSIIADLNRDSTSILLKNSDLISNLYKSINECKTTEATEGLEKLVSQISTDYNLALQEKKSSNKRSKELFLDEIFDSSSGTLFLTSFLIIYFLMIMQIFRNRKFRERFRRILFGFERSDKKLEEIIKNEVEEKEILERLEAKADDIINDKKEDAK